MITILNSNSVSFFILHFPSYSAAGYLRGYLQMGPTQKRPGGRLPLRGPLPLRQREHCPQRCCCSCAVLIAILFRRSQPDGDMYRAGEVPVLAASRVLLLTLVVAALLTSPVNESWLDGWSSSVANPLTSPTNFRWLDGWLVGWLVGWFVVVVSVVVGCWCTCCCWLFWAWGWDRGCGCISLSPFFSLSWGLRYHLNF